MRKFLTVLFISLSVIALSNAQQGEWYNDDGGYTLEGFGTKNNPYIISSETSFVYLAEKINSSFDGIFDGKYFLLTEDLDLGAHYWIPVGSDELHPFKGIFDGNGKTIRNLYIRSTETKEFSATGLFGYVGNGAIIENLTIEGGKVAGCSSQSISRTGSLAGYLLCNVAGGEDSIIIKNCHNNGVTVTGGQTDYSNTGGLIGEGYAFCDSDGAVDITIEDCTNSGEVIAATSGFPYTGGIIGKGRGHGYCFGSISSHGSFHIRSCINKATITGGNTTGTDAVSSTGGIFGFGYASGDGYGDSDGTGVFTTELCMNTGAVKGGDAASINAYTYTGGIFGYGDGYGYGDISGSSDKQTEGNGYGSGMFTVTSCTNNGHLSGGDASKTGTVSATGGIFGFGSGSGAGDKAGNGYAYGSFSLRNCYSAADISTTNGYIGGLGGCITTIGSGPNYVISAILQDCYVAGSINADVSSYDDVITGGIIGRMHRTDDANEDPKVDRCLAVLSYLAGSENKTYQIAGQLLNIRSAKALTENYAYIKEGYRNDRRTIQNGYEWSGTTAAPPISEWNASDRVWFIQENSRRYMPRLRNIPDQPRVVIP